jgi:acetylornithine deacetylase/succinyl-diaminopimelate desuccinylase-like protein
MGGPAPRYPLTQFGNVFYFFIGTLSTVIEVPVAKPNERFAAIDEAVDRERDAIVATVIDLVGIQTHTPPGENYDKIVERLVPQFRSLGFEARRYDMPDDVFAREVQTYHPAARGVRSNMLAIKNCSDKPGLLLYTHLDTKPAGELGNWSTPPFAAHEQDGYIYGRGTADSKGGVAAILHAFRVLKALGIEPSVSPHIALTTDEEMGPYTGLMHMADAGLFDKCKWFLSCDGYANCVGVGNNGGLTWTIRVEGKSVHSGSWFLGINPIEHSLPLLEELLKLKAEVTARRSKLPISPDMADPPLRTHTAPAFNITIAKAGYNYAAIPPEFILEGDRRIIPEENAADCVKEIEDAVARAKARDPDLKCSLEIRPLFRAGYQRDPDDPWVRHICALVSQIRGTPIKAAGMNGCSDVGHVANRLPNMRVAVNGLARFAETRNHSPNERCRVEDVLHLTKIVAVLAAGAFEAPEQDGARRM